MIHVFPNKLRSIIMRYVMWLPVFLQVLWLHHDNGVEYAMKWANASLNPPKDI